MVRVKIGAINIKKVIAAALNAARFGFSGEFYALKLFFVDWFGIPSHAARVA